VITDATIVYLSATDWDGAWHGPQELAKRFGEAGNRVIYVETLGWRRPRLFDVPRIAGRLGKAMRGRLGRARRGRLAASASRPPAPGVELVSPLLIPGARTRAEIALNRRLLLRTLAARLGRSPRRPVILWIYTPSRLTVGLPGALGEDLCLYHCTQSHPDRPIAPPDTAQAERKLIALADLVVVDGIRLYEERAPLHPHVYRIPSGVNPDQHDAARPLAFAGSVRRPVIGYMGTIDHRIDPGLLTGLARARPDASLVLVGPVVDADVRELAALPNVVLHGPVPIEQVPAALAGFDVGVMPYADQPMTPYTYPAKLHQYLAAGLPIASTPLPDLAEFADLVEVGEGAAGLAAAVARALSGPRREDERRRVAAENTWERRAERLSSVLEGHLAGAPPPSSSGMDDPDG
jgi:glycosyltransferase involved in cell wall biosynthesis